MEEAGGSNPPEPTLFTRIPVIPPLRHTAVTVETGVVAVSRSASLPSDMRLVWMRASSAQRRMKDGVAHKLRRRCCSTRACREIPRTRSRTTLPEMLGQFLIDHNETNSGYYPQIWFKV